ncbi:dipeptidyl aminopeptidase/acylaminoacyl peptidase [Peribacillus deserti]|uniref:Dipeptidyl aminopeptidase/acylaminoacyl peptidase n=1 Tax=Peribacillus deserti TaxID=673318 RepID=A0ABS2QJU2_9BACI|nr:S9 family peptidase [Peribacillus deserti]MBM7693429.1 dipeptidyl aminopeptidase/acylaminoacyl peptidase [Peribacillus deserti]
MRGISAEDLYQLYSVTDPQLSPCGEKAAFVKTIADLDNHYTSNIYLLDLNTRSTSQWTFGKHKNHSPRWSPDGEKLAFLSNRSGETQIYLISKNGGEAECLTELNNGAGSIVWSPCSSKILFSSGVTPGEPYLIDPKNKEKDVKPSKAAIFNKVRYKSDSSGYLKDTYQQLFILDIETKALNQVSEGDWDCSPSDWSPDGTAIVYSASEDEDRDYAIISDVYMLNLSNNEKTKLTGGSGYYSDAHWSPDGRYLSLIGHEKEYKGASLPKIWLYDTQYGELSCLTSEWDAYIGDIAIGDFHAGGSDSGITWTSDSLGFYFIMSDHGSTGVYYGTVEGAMYPSRLEPEHIYGLSINPHTHQAVVAISHPANPGDLYSLNLTNGTLQQMTNVNQSYLNDIELTPAEPFSWKAPDGKDLHGWIIKPLKFKQDQKYPLILEIHGGPHAMYANTYYHEFQTLSAQGFTVLYTNPRGSHGYGQEFVNAVRGDYGGDDYKDIMSAVDHALASYSYIDETRLGVTGGSYGGFMTNWIIGRTNRFKAAVTQRCISNWLSFYGVSDIGYYFTEWELKGNVIENPEMLWNHSPLKYVSQVETPLLLLHGEKDYRCPIEQAEQFFVALKRQRKEAVLVSYPGENHEITRSGKPFARINHTEQIRDWFLTYLK